MVHHSPLMAGKKFVHVAFVKALRDGQLPQLSDASMIFSINPEQLSSTPCHDQEIVNESRDICDMYAYDCLTADAIKEIQNIILLQ